MIHFDSTLRVFLEVHTVFGFYQLAHILCQFINVTYSFYFILAINLSRLRPELIFTEAGQKKYVDVGTDACQDLTQGKCPIEQGYPLVYYKTLKVDASWIKVRKLCIF